MTPYYMYIPHYIYIPVSDNEKGAALTGPQVAGMLIFIIWLITTACVAEELALDIEDRVFSDNKQDIKRHTIELITLIAIGLIILAMEVMTC